MVIPPLMHQLEVISSGRLDLQNMILLLSLSANSAPSQKSSFCVLLQPASFDSLHMALGIGIVPCERDRSNRGPDYQRYLDEQRRGTITPLNRWEHIPTQDFHSAAAQGIGTKPTEENWGHDTLEDSSFALPHEQIMPSGLPCQKQNMATSGQFIWNTPPTDHWGYHIAEEALSMNPIQATTRSPKVTLESSQPQFSEELLVLIMDIRRDVANLLFQQECLNRRLDFLHDMMHCQVSRPPTLAELVTNPSASSQPDTSIPPEATTQILLVLIPFVLSFCFMLFI